MRGEFRFQNGCILRNSVTTSGQRQYLRMLFQNAILPEFWIGATDSIPTMSATLATINEPTIGVNGYARIQVPRSAAGWPTEGESAGVPWIETSDLVFTAIGAAFDKPITRLFLTPESTLTIGDVFAIGAAFPAPLIVDPSTPLADRTFRYRVYMI